MAAATQARPSKAATKASDDARTAIMGVATDLKTNVLIERNAETNVLILALVAGVNAHLLGPAGTAKSLASRATAERIVGARYFEKAVHAQMPADAIIGGYDMPNFAKTGEFARNVEHYAPNAHIVFLDEITRANGPTLDALLPMLNTEERRAEANGGMFKTPIMFVVTASNFMPDPDDAHLGALVDRFTLMQYVEAVKADESFREMFRRHHARRIQERTNTATPATMTLEQLELAQIECEQVEATAVFLDAYADLRRRTKAEGLQVSDRRWMELGRVARASAWLSDRTELIPEDLAAVEHGLWRDRTDMPKAHMLVKDFLGRFEQAATKHREELAAALETMEQLRPIVEGTPPTEMLDGATMSQVNSAGRVVMDVHKRVRKALAEAAVEKRDAPGLRDIDSELLAVQTWLKDNTLNYDRTIVNANGG